MLTTLLVLIVIAYIISGWLLRTANPLPIFIAWFFVGLMVTLFIIRPSWWNQPGHAYDE